MISHPKRQPKGAGKFGENRTQSPSWIPSKPCTNPLKTSLVCTRKLTPITPLLNLEKFQIFPLVLTHGCKENRARKIRPSCPWFHPKNPSNLPPRLSPKFFWFLSSISSLSLTFSLAWWLLKVSSKPTDFGCRERVSLYQFLDQKGGLSLVDLLVDL